MDALDKGMIPVPSKMEREGMRFHLIVQNGAQCKSYKLFISTIFHLIFSGHNCPQVTENAEGEISGKQGDHCVSMLSLARRCTVEVVLGVYSPSRKNDLAPTQSLSIVSCFEY